MDVTKLQELIPASFSYTDSITQESSEIELKVQRMQFNKVSRQKLVRALEDEDHPAISEMLSQLIADWNLTAGDDPFPPTAENIGVLPPEFVMEAANVVGAKLFPNPPKAETSESGSAQEERLSATPA